MVLHTLPSSITRFTSRSGPGSANPCAQYPPDAAQSPRAWHTRSEPSEQMLPRKYLRKRHVPRTLTCGGHFLRTTLVVRMPFALLQPAVRRSQLATQRLPSCTPAPQIPHCCGAEKKPTPRILTVSAGSIDSSAASFLLSTSKMLRKRAGRHAQEGAPTHRVRNAPGLPAVGRNFAPHRLCQGIELIVDFPLVSSVAAAHLAVQSDAVRVRLRCERATNITARRSAVRRGGMGTCVKAAWSSEAATVWLWNMGSASTISSAEPDLRPSSAPWTPACGNFSA